MAQVRVSAFVTHAQVPTRQRVSPGRKCGQVRSAPLHHAPKRTRAWRMVDTSAPPKSATQDESSQPSQKFTWTEQWYPVSFEVDIEDDVPFAFTLFDEPLVLFRTAPHAYAVVEDRCSHRLAPLSEGRVVKRDNGNVEIECAYHGWSFGGCGTCTRIPQNPDGATIPRRASITSFETTIVGGIIWMWYGQAETADASRIPLPPLMEQYKENELILYRNVSRIVPYSLEAQMENPLDPVHIFWAHVGAEKMYRREYGGVGNEVTLKEREVSRMTALWQGNEIAFCPPCVSYWQLNRGIELNAWFAITPLSRRKSRLFMIEVSKRDRKLSLKTRLFLAKPRWMQHLLFNKTVDGDNIIVNALERNLGDARDWRAKCVPTNTDSFVVAMRAWMDEYRDAMPWRTAPDDSSVVEQQSRRNLLERFDSHTKYCTACKGALKNFSIAERVLGVVLQACISLFVVAVLACVPSFAAAFGMASTNPTAVRVSVIVLVVLLFAVVRLKAMCVSYIEKLTFTEESHEAYLAGYSN